MKKWALGHGMMWAVGGLTLWFLGLLCLAATFKQSNIAIASIVLVYFNVTTLALVERFFFDTPFSVTKMIGALLGLIAVAIMEFA